MIGCRCSRVEPQADQLQQSFHLKPGIEQIDHLLQREPGLFPSRRQLRNDENQRGVLHNFPPSLSVAGGSHPWWHWSVIQITSVREYAHSATKSPHSLIDWHQRAEPQGPGQDECSWDVTPTTAQPVTNGQESEAASERYVDKTNHGDGDQDRAKLVRSTSYDALGPDDESSGIFRQHSAKTVN